MTKAPSLPPARAHTSRELFGRYWRGYLRPHLPVMLLAFVVMMIEGSTLGLLSYMLSPVATGLAVDKTYLIAALTLALATMTMGVMGGFALVFVPAWIAFRRAGSWRRGLMMAVLIGVVGYVTAFILALWLDQPFGPVLALLLVTLGLVIA